METHKASPEMQKFFENLIDIKSSMRKIVVEYSNIIDSPLFEALFQDIKEIYHELDSCIKSTEEKK